MFKIIQSNDSQILAQHLSVLYQKPTRGNVFEPFVVIVPAMVLEEWLKKTIARHAKISTLITTQFWGQYQWQMIGKVLDKDAPHQARLGGELMRVPDVAVLSQAVIRWRIFSYLMSKPNGAINGADNQTLAELTLNDKTHPLHLSLMGLSAVDDGGNLNLAQDVLWRFCETLARLYVQYLTERTDWLHTWATGGRLNVQAMIDDKDRLSATLNRPEWQDDNSQNDKADTDEFLTPAWLCEHYVALEGTLGFLWRTLFSQVFLYRERLEAHFWQVLANKTHPDYASIIATLPKTLHLFTVQQLPQTELNFLKKLSQYTDVVLLHFNPSAMFWADIVDKNWLTTQRLIRPQAVYLKDYGHGLLSRLGKVSRETFAMLADMAGGEHSGDFVVDWQDDFNEFNNHAPSLLTALKKDILMLDESEVLDNIEHLFSKNLSEKHAPTAEFYFNPVDDSLRIHNCHSLKRELEVARVWIGRWLNEPNADGKPRVLGDVAIMLPDVERHRELLEVMFNETAGLDGLTLPAKITGVQDKKVGELWAGIFGIFRLTAGRFYYEELCEWLLLSSVYEAFGMDLAMALRACELLKMAGFVRGFDEAHLAKTLNVQDKDYRLSFAYALDRLTASLVLADGLSELLYPFDWADNTLPEKTATLAGVRLEDGAIIQALCRIYQAFLRGVGRYEEYRAIEAWLDWLETDIIDVYFYRYKNDEVLRGIFKVMNAVKSSLRASRYYAQVGYAQASHEAQTLALPLKFVLETIATAITNQKISSETSDVIQIGRFGSLRGMSFGLVVMLGMNLSEFPRFEPISRLDLAKAGLPRRGDRVGEDDDNGAFLEAILQAQDNCWIFYSGQTPSGTSVRLPATPVGELITFIKNAHWQGDNDTRIDTAERVEKWLIVQHPALPFERGVFEGETLANASNHILTNNDIIPPPAPLWQAVYRASQNHRQTPDPITLPSQTELQAMAHWLTSKAKLDKAKSNKVLTDELTLPTSLTLSKLTRAITKPNRTYLNGKFAKIGEISTDKEGALSLDTLNAWQMNDLLLSAHLDKPSADGEWSFAHSLTHWRLLPKSLERLYYESLLPAGAGRVLALTETEQKTQKLFEAFFANQALLVNENFLNTTAPPTPTNQTLHVLDLNWYNENWTMELMADLPADNAPIWRAISPSKYSSSQLLTAFIRHTAWQVVRAKTSNTADDGQAGLSFWQFMPDNKDNKKSNFIAFRPMNGEVAAAVFGRLIAFAELAKHYPIVLTADVVASQLFSENPTELSDESLKTWLAAPSGASDYVSENSSFHPDWSLILGKADKEQTLADTLRFVPILYQALLHSFIKINTL